MTSPVEAPQSARGRARSAAITAGALLVFLYTVSEFGAVTVLRYDTLTTSIYATRLFDRPRSLALSLVLAVVALAVVVGERAVARRVPVVEATRTRRPLQVPLGRWRWPAAVGLVLWFGATLGGPAATLVRWTSPPSGMPWPSCPGERSPWGAP